MNYTQKTSSFWWTRNPATVIYFLRELTGTFIALYVIYFLSLSFYAAMTKMPPTFLNSISFHVVSWTGLVAAIFHTLTWLWVTIKIAPVTLKKPVAVAAFIILLGIWIGLSYFLLKFLYVAR